LRDLEVNLCRAEDFPLASFPLAVFLKRFAAPLFVLVFGTQAHLPHYAFTTLAGFSFAVIPHPADPASMLAADSTFPFRLLEKQIKGGTRLILHENPFIILATQ
jgi:hypothetical protein